MYIFQTDNYARPNLEGVRGHLQTEFSMLNVHYIGMCIYTNASYTLYVLTRDCQKVGGFSACNFEKLSLKQGLGMYM